MVYVFGRMNPPTRAHIELIKHGMGLANQSQADFKLLISYTINEVNPLTHDEKSEIIKNVLGIEVDQNKLTNPFLALEFFATQYTDITFLVGSDRKDNFENMHKYSRDFGIPSFKISVFGDLRREDLQEGIESISASKARAYAQEDNFELFKTQIAEMSGKEARALFNRLRR